MQRKEKVIYINKEGHEVEPMPFFLYEFSICKYSKNSFEVVYNKQYKSNKPIKVPPPLYEKRPKKDPRGYFYARFVDWLGAPMSYILNNNFKKVEYGSPNRKSGAKPGTKSRSSQKGRKKD